MKCLIKLAALSLVVLLISSCSMSKGQVEKRLKPMLQEFMDTNPSLKKLQGKVTDVVLVKVAANEYNYKGQFSVSVFNNIYNINITAIADKDTVQYELAPGALSVLDGADTVVIDGLTFRLNNDGSCFMLTRVQDVEDVNIPETIFGIWFGGYFKDRSPFKNAKGIRLITLPDVPWDVEVESESYYGCSLVSIRLPNTTTSIETQAFSSCKSLTSIIIPDSVTSIGSSAFSYCTSLTSIVIPDSVTSIGSSAFRYCTSLTSIVIPDSVTSIGGSAFSTCTSLTSVVIPDSVTSIGRGAFAECTSLTSIVIPDSVTSIGDQDFLRCTSLTSVVIPDSVTSIGRAAFAECTSLTSIVIPDSVTSIGDDAFRYCTSLDAQSRQRIRSAGYRGSF